MVAEVERLKPDVLMLQEVSLDAGVPEKLAQKLPNYHLSLCGREGRNAHLGHAILSLKKPSSEERLALSQQRIAQKITLSISGKKIILVNVHAYFNLLRDGPRQQHIRQILDFADKPAIIGGDFNALPSYKSLKLIQERFVSAHLQANGSEPAKTMPTPLWRGPGIRHSMRRSGLRLHGGGTVDYIFVEKSLKIAKCRIAFDKPAPNNPLLFASDHFGLVADIVI